MVLFRRFSIGLTIQSCKKVGKVINLLHKHKKNIPGWALIHKLKTSLKDGRAVGLFVYFIFTRWSEFNNNRNVKFMVDHQQQISLKAYGPRMKEISLGVWKNTQKSFHLKQNLYNAAILHNNNCIGCMLVSY
jgi:hypothetical protein